MKTPKIHQKCVICGENEATTVDHVPPKNLFPKPRPSLITVPACAKCNNFDSGIDEKFMLYFSLQVGPEHEATRRLWHEKASKALKRNKRFQREIFGSMNEVLVKTATGTIEKRMSFLAEKEVYDRVFERTVRGLYYHHFKEILGDGVEISIYPSTTLSDEVCQQTVNLPQNSIGNDALIYKFGRVADVQKASMWIFQLYNRHWILVITEPKD
jgi:hypothetical protein